MPKKGNKQGKQVKKTAAANPKPKPKQNAIARGLLGLGSGAANLFLPGSGGLVNSLGQKLLDSLGLSEKITMPPGFGGEGGDVMHMTGPVVASANAPVAFGREESPNSFVKVLHREPNGDIIVHSKEFWLDVVTADTASTLTTTEGQYTPYDSVAFPLIARIASAFQLYRVLAIRLHYVHYAPTSEQARVALFWAHSADAADDLNSATFSELTQIEDFTVGSAYEDFGLTAHPEALVNWYQSNITGSSAPTDQIYQGCLGYSVDQNASTEKQIGSVYVETLIAFHSTAPPQWATSMSKNILEDKQLDPEQKAKLLSSIALGTLSKDNCAAVYSGPQRFRRRQAAKTGATPIKDFHLAEDYRDLAVAPSPGARPSIAPQVPSCTGIRAASVSRL